MKFIARCLLFILSTTLYADITTRFQSSVRSDSTHLGQILSFAPEEPKLSMLPLDDLLISQRMLTKSQIMAWLEQTTNRHDYSWQGKTTALIKQIAQSSSDELVAKAKNQLRTVIQQHHHYEAIKLIAKTKPAASTVPLTALKAQIKSSYPPPKRICVRLYNEQHIIPIWFEVRAQQSVLVARSRLNKRDTLKADDFVIETRNIAGLIQAPLQQLPNNYILKKPMHPHDILMQDHISPTPLVMKGAKTKLHIHTTGITITTEAIAQEDGYLGQNIILQHPNTKKSIQALVIAPAETEVH